MKYIYDPKCLKHLTGSDHPEKPSRISVIDKALEKEGLEKMSPRMAQEEEILLCHTESYLKKVKQEIQELKENEIKELSTGDVPISKGSLEAALLAAGAVLTAVDLVVKEPQPIFCNIRPPGHHAFADHGEGFCLFNNVAIGAKYAQKKYGVKKILIADWDVHHGNGTEAIFYDDPTVFYFSTHQSPLYPGTGLPEDKGKHVGAGFTLNVPVSSSQNARQKILEAFEDLREKMRQFRPELIFISAGFDAHQDDYLGSLNLKASDFAHLTEIVNEIAKESAQGKIISVLEGGYNLEALEESVLAHVRALNAS